MARSLLFHTQLLASGAHREFRLAAHASPVTRRALATLAAFAADPVAAAASLYGALDALEIDHRGELPAEWRRARRQLRAELRAVHKRWRALKLVERAPLPRTTPTWNPLGFRIESLHELEQAARHFDTALLRILEELTDPVGRPRPSLTFFDEVATHLREHGLESGDLADLILASGEDWTPDPCPKFRPVRTHPAEAPARPPQEAPPRPPRPNQRRSSLHSSE